MMMVSIARWILVIFFGVILTRVAGISNEFGTVSTNGPKMVDTPPMTEPLLASESTNKVSIESIKTKLETQKPPIFEFGRELEELVRNYEEPVSLVTTEQLYQQYADALRDYYFQEFLNRCEQCGSRQTWCEQCELVKREAEAAMKTAMPSSVPLSYQNQLEELVIDMESTITGAWDETEEELALEKSNKPSKFSWLWNARNKKRLKWIFSQTILLVLNFVQYEWHRRSARRAAQKRLAEVPEFPLL